jgi:hypothetical protein
MINLPTTEKEFIEEILAILDESPHLHNPTRLYPDPVRTGWLGSVCFYNRPREATELSADHCAIGFWLVNHDFPVEELDLVACPAHDAFIALGLPEEWIYGFGDLADGVQSLVDAKPYPEAKTPLSWGEAAKKIRSFYETELS